MLDTGEPAITSAATINFFITVPRVLCFPDHRSRCRIERPDVLDVLIAEAALEQRRADGRRADGLELVARCCGKHGRVPTP